MTETEEARAVAEVATRMRERFPYLSPSAIDEVVGELHHQFDGTPIREFIPVLIENDARDRLTRLPQQRTSAEAGRSLLA
jgi:hypothetical protein